jgi:hypothetical protein
VTEPSATSDPGRARPAVVVVAVAAVLFVMSGIAGISVGGGSAQAGWWLVAVGVLVLAVLVVEHGRR